MLKLYRVYDKKAEAYLPIFCSRAEGEAVRVFTNAINGDDVMFNAYPNDYRLCFVGDDDERTGRTVTCDPISICEGKDVSDHEFSES